MKNRAFILLPLIASLVACGGDGVTTNGAASSTGTVSLLVTDNLTLSYSEVWVNIRSITATNANNQSVTLYQDATGQTHNLSQLANIGALVDTQSVAPGTYTSFQITLANSITLTDLNGIVTHATFDQSGNPAYVMTVPGGLTINANQATTLALDFNLQQFTYNAATNTVTPVVIQKDHRTLHQTIATTRGQVQTVVSPTQFILTPATGGANITVNLHSSVMVISSSTGAVTTDTTALQAGMSVKVAGSYDANTLTITAASVLINDGALVIRDEIEGIVTFFDGATLTVDVKEASFTPDSNTINVTNFDIAKFSRGTLALLGVGQKVEIKGSRENDNFSAAIIEIEGGSRNSGNNHHVDDYAELKGRITVVDGVNLTIAVSKYEHVNGVSNGSLVMINSANSWISKGDSSCLVVGAQIEVKGAMSDAATLDATIIEIKSDCAKDGNTETQEDETDADH